MNKLDLLGEERESLRDSDSVVCASAAKGNRHQNDGADQQGITPTWCSAPLHITADQEGKALAILDAKANASCHTNAGKWMLGVNSKVQARLVNFVVFHPKKGFQVSCPACRLLVAGSHRERRPGGSIHHAIRKYLNPSRNSPRLNVSAKSKSAAEVEAPAFLISKRQFEPEKASFRCFDKVSVWMTDGQRMFTMPRHNPVNAFSSIIRDAGSQQKNFVSCFR